MKPKITIITPSFNQGQFLEQTIDSVLSQSYPNLEYIIIDGGSTDRSVEIIKRYQRHLAFWVSERDRGQSHAINKGLALATGAVVNWLNSDDYYEPEALSCIGDFFSDHTVNVLCARSNIVQGNSIARRTTGTDVYIDNLAKTIGWARIDQPETFFRLEAYRTVGLLNERLHYVMDREWWMRYLLHYGLEGVKKSNDVVVNFRLHDQSKTQRRRNDFEAENFALFRSWAMRSGLEYFFSDFVIEASHGVEHLASQLKIDSLAFTKEVFSYFLLQWADKEYYAGNSKMALKILSKLDLEHFAPMDRNLLERIRFRSRFVPFGLRKMIRR